jgi:hypothetical protein
MAGQALGLVHCGHADHHRSRVDRTRWRPERPGTGRALSGHYAAVTRVDCAYRMNTRHPFPAGRIAVAGGGLSLAVLTACSSGSASTTPPGSGGAGTSAASDGSAVTGQSSGKTVDGCTLVTAQQLSAAVGVKYTAVQASGTGTICNVTGASATDSFYYHVDKEDGSLNTWSGELAVIKEDDGSYATVSAESGGYIIVVVNADVNNPSTASSFTRTKKIEKLLISKI